jgi:hypothetical protein
MILYHGSCSAIEKPDLAFARERTDFGRGFYTTPIKEQAERWARRLSADKKAAVVSSYKFLERTDEDISSYRVLEFNAHSKKWLDFITANRIGPQPEEAWDLIIGGVANDKVFNTLELYFKGEYTEREAIRRLRYNKPNYQYCFKSKELIDCYLRYSGSEEIV